MIGVLHAYSRSNAGDGLLVDLTVQRLARAGVARDDLLLVALDPESFSEFPQRIAMGTRRRGLGWELLPATGRAAGLTLSALGVPAGSLGRRLATCDALVAVGGGYLRAVDGVSSMGTTLNHLPQVLAAGRARQPSLYLPQSIGPLRGPAGWLARRVLSRVGTVCVRDAWSESDLAGLPNVRRVPDLAVLDVAERWDEIEPVGRDGPVGLVARSVHHATGYESHLRSVSDRLGDRAIWAVQTAGHPTKSDAVHYERLGVSAGGGLAAMLERRELSVVVSVRLHGALMAIRAGVPAIHLAYDRKGPGAFADLGLDDWCHDVRSLDSGALTTAIDGLLADPQPYWDRIAKHVPSLQTTSDELDELVNETVG